VKLILNRIYKAKDLSGTWRLKSVNKYRAMFESVEHPSMSSSIPLCNIAREEFKLTNQIGHSRTTLFK